MLPSRLFCFQFVVLFSYIVFFYQYDDISNPIPEKKNKKHGIDDFFLYFILFFYRHFYN